MWSLLLSRTKAALRKQLLVSVFPNPFSAELHLELEFKTGSRAELIIYNLKGQRVKSWTLAQSGKQSLVWNGLNEKGGIVASGVYLLRIKTSKQEKLVKVLKLK